VLITGIMLAIEKFISQCDMNWFSRRSFGKSRCLARSFRA